MHNLDNLFLTTKWFKYKCLYCYQKTQNFVSIRKDYGYCVEYTIICYECFKKLNKKYLNEIFDIFGYKCKFFKSKCSICSNKKYHYLYFATKWWYKRVCKDCLYSS